jgi:hypothetical protein
VNCVTDRSPAAQNITSLFTPRTFFGRVEARAVAAASAKDHAGVPKWRGIGFAVSILGRHPSLPTQKSGWSALGKPIHSPS